MKTKHSRLPNTIFFGAAILLACSSAKALDLPQNVTFAIPAVIDPVPVPTDGALNVTVTATNSTAKATLEALPGFRVIQNFTAVPSPNAVQSLANNYILNATDSPTTPDLKLSYFVGPAAEDALATAAANTVVVGSNIGFQSSLGSSIRIQGNVFNSAVGLRIEAGAWDGSSFTSGVVKAMGFTVNGPFNRMVGDSATVTYYDSSDNVLSTQVITSAPVTNVAAYTGHEVTSGPLIKYATVSFKGDTVSTSPILSVDDIGFAPNPSAVPTPVKWAVGNGDWDTATSNWQPLAGGAATTYVEGADVTFNETATGTSPITVAMVNTRTPATINVNGPKDYVFADEGGDITGGGSLTKSGEGTLTLNTDNTLSGATTLTQGTIRLNRSGALQSSAVTLNGGSLVFDASAGSDFTLGNLSSALAGPGYDLALQDNAGSPSAINLTIGANGLPTTYAGVLSGPGSLIKDGPGILTLSNANTYTGDTTLLGTGALRLTNANALGTTGTVNLFSSQNGAGITTFEINGGINFSRPIVADPTFGPGRAHFTGSGGANTLSSPIEILNAGANPTSFESAGGAGNLFTVSGTITADPSYTADINLRGSSGGIFSSTVNAPGATLTLLAAANNVVWTVSGSGSDYGLTKILSGTGPLVDGANQGFSGIKLIIGNNDALDPTARILWANNNNNLAGGTIDLAGFNQTVAGLDKPFSNASQPLAVPTPPLPPNPPVPNSIPDITNSSTTADSTLTIANIAANNAVTAPFYAHAYVGKISDGPTRKLNLVYDSIGKTQGLVGAPGFLSYRGNTTIKFGTLSVVNPNFADSSTLKIGENPGDDAVLNLPSVGTDTVALLVIDGVTFTSGVFGPEGSGAPNETNAITGFGRINVEPFVASPYDTWVASFQPGFTLNLPGQDQDGDGLTNQQEFAFGLNPKSGASVSPIIGGLAANGQFSYTRLANSGLVYKIYTSTTLGGWVPDEGATDSQNVGPANGNGVQTVVVTLTATPVNGKLFARVQAD